MKESEIMSLELDEARALAVRQQREIFKLQRHRVQLKRQLEARDTLLQHREQFDHKRIIQAIKEELCRLAQQ